MTITLLLGSGPVSVTAQAGQTILDVVQAQAGLPIHAPCPLFVETGSINKIVPVIIIRKNPSAIICTCDIFKCFSLFCIFFLLQCKHLCELYLFLC